MRGQTELPALGIAFLLLTSTLVFGVFLADGSLNSAERPALEERTAITLSERLVAADAPQTRRANVLALESIARLDEQTLRSEFNVPQRADVELKLGDETLLKTGTVRGSAIERIVLVERRTQERIYPQFDNSRTVTLPRRSSNARVTIAPPSGTTIERIYGNNHVLLANESGLRGTFDVSLSPYATTTLRFEGPGVLEKGSVRIDYEPPETTKTTLEVRVDV